MNNDENIDVKNNVDVMEYMLHIAHIVEQGCTSGKIIAGSYYKMTDSGYDNKKQRVFWQITINVRNQ